ncbi:MAG: HDIG domain-containing protein [Gemmatimonadetes bacterium]|nr:HDIG domain-containing protein [Gemmatimonadota bacterium]
MNERRRSRPRPETDARGWAAVRFHAARWAPVLGLALLTYVLYPAARGFEAPIVETGQVAPSEVLAPFEYAVHKSPQELAQDAEALAATVRPIYEYDATVIDSVRRRVDTVFSRIDTAGNAGSIVDIAGKFGIRLSPDEGQFLEPRARRNAFHNSLSRFLLRQLTQGVAPRGTIERELSREIVMRREGRERVVPRDSVLSYAAFLDRRTRDHPAGNSSVGDQLYVKLITGVFQPTVVPNAAATEALRGELRASVDSVKDVVRANERIVNAHEVVSPQAHARLLALRAELLRRGGALTADLPATIGQILTNVFTLSLFWLLLMLYRREAYSDLRQMFTLSALFATVIAGAAINRAVIAEGPELIPIPFATMLITVLFSGRVSMVAAMVLAVLLGSQAVYGGQAALYLAVLGGVSGALGVRMIRRRSQLLTASAIVAGAFLLGAVTVALRFDWTWTQLGLSVGRGSANAVVSSALVMFMLPVFESMAGVTTDIKLLELSDPSHPLLRRLATEASGTYAHSVAMANLCEAACNAIGANGLLARVGCYFHDIGKVRRPQFYVENQSLGNNPHDRLEPEMSAGIIRSHVRDGLALAEEYRLPEVVKGFIPEHHGTSEISYFLDRARAQGDDVEEDPELYRYPGPKPRSIETAVTMLADGVEAALRVLDDPTPAKIRDAIDHIFQQRIESGQLVEAPLTLAQFSKVREEFVRVLTGMHHTRIDYPSASGGISSEWEPASRA